jgi:hypothetical protein
MPGAIYDQELVFEQKRDSATRERTPPGWNNWVRTAIKWMKRTRK